MTGHRFLTPVSDSLLLILVTFYLPNFLEDLFIPCMNVLFSFFQLYSHFCLCVVRAGNYFKYVYVYWLRGKMIVCQIFHFNNYCSFDSGKLSVWPGWLLWNPWNWLEIWVKNFESRDIPAPKYVKCEETQSWFLYHCRVGRVEIRIENFIEKPEMAVLASSMQSSLLKLDRGNQCPCSNFGS